MLALALPVVIGTVVVIVGSLKNDDDTSSRDVIVPFGTAAFTVGDSPTEYCALLATTSEAQQQGMQHRSDLGGYDAMVFAFAEDTSVQFVNHFVPVDLDIGWYDANGALVDHTSMDKCPDGENCPTYGAAGLFRFAVETLTGGLADLGLTRAGATLHVGGAC